MAKKKQWVVSQSKIAYQTPWFHIKKDDLLTPTGKKWTYYILEKKPAVAIIALTNKKEIVFIEIYRPTIRQKSLEIPAGTLEKSEAPTKTVIRELEEETGFLAKKIKPLGHYFVAPGFTNQKGTVFLATNLIKTKQKLGVAEEGIKVKLIPEKQVFEIVAQGKITDNQTLAALFIYFSHKKSG